MKKKLNCEQISALIAFYLDGTLSPKLAKYVQEHIENCTQCQDRYCKEIIIDTFVSDDINNSYITKQYEIFKDKLSEYVDNELDDTENIKMKKITISNPLARQDLEDIYSFKKLIHSAYEKTKNELKTDYSKNVINQLLQNKSYISFYKISALFFIMIASIVAGFIKILYF